jgi:molybdopterin-biosynthesis enzyme MoeA-like protein
MAGVPHIAGEMLESLSGQVEGGAPMVSRTIGCWTPESEVAELLSDTEASHPGTQIGSYPFFREGRVGANFVVRSTDTVALNGCAQDLLDALGARGLEVIDEEL